MDFYVETKKPKGKKKESAEKTVYYPSSAPYVPLPDYLTIDTGNNNGYKEQHTIHGGNGSKFTVTVDASKRFLTVKGKVFSTFVIETHTTSVGTHTTPTDTSDKGETIQVEVASRGHIKARVTIYQLKNDRVQKGGPTLWITGRGVCCCETGIEHPSGRKRRQYHESVVWEGALDGEKKEAEMRKKDDGGMSIRDANQIRVEIGQRLLQSVNDVNRYEAGSVSFAETQFVAKSTGRHSLKARITRTIIR